MQAGGTKRVRSDEESAAARAVREAKKQQRAHEREAAAAAAAAGGAWRLTTVQPWAGKEAAPTELTEEQKEYIAKLEAEKEAKAGSKKKADAVRGDLMHVVRPAPESPGRTLHLRVIAWLSAGQGVRGGPGQLPAVLAVASDGHRAYVHT